MTVYQLKELLNLYPPEVEVLAFDPEVSFHVPVTGAVFSNSDNTLELTTDD